MDPVSARPGLLKRADDPPAQAVLIDYLRSFGVTAGPELEEGLHLLADVIAPFEPVEWSLVRARAKVGAWFQRALGLGPTAYEAEAMGRAAYLLTGAAHRWPSLLLSDRELPPEFLSAIRSAAPVGAWQTAPSAMPVQVLETPSLAGLLRGLGEITDALRTPRQA